MKLSENVLASVEATDIFLTLSSLVLCFEHT